MPFENLKGINLIGCKSIQKLPELWAPHLEILNLSDCTNLVEIRELAGFVDKLEIWNLSSCLKLQALPRRLKIKCLEHFSLEYCESIQEFPELCAPNLKSLCLNDCKSLVKVHESVGLLDKLKDLYFEGCGKLQTLPRRLTLKSLRSFNLIGCTSLENFLDIDLELKCLKHLYLHWSGIRESLEFERKLLDRTFKFQKLEGLSIFTNLPRPTCNSFDGCVRYSFLQLEALTLFNENVTELDFLEFDYFPALRNLSLENTSTVTILESFIKFTKLMYLKIVDCKHFEEIQGLPQDLSYLEARNWPSWNPQS